MTTRFEWHDVNHAAIEFVDAGTEIGDNLTDTPTLILSTDEAAVFHGTQDNLLAFFRRVVARLEQEPDPAPRLCAQCGDEVEVGLSSRDWCDGCEEEAELAASAGER